MTAIFIAAMLCADRPAQRPLSSIVKLNTSAGFSSGVVIQHRENDILILTCAHGKKPKEQLTVEISGVKPISGWVVCYDEKRDLAIVSATQLQVPPRVTFMSKNRPAQGDIVKSKGFALNKYHENRTTVVGIKNITAGGITRDRLQVRFDTKPGDSGGVLLDADGGIIGITNSHDIDVKNPHGYFVTIDDIYDFLKENGVQP